MKKVKKVKIKIPSDITYARSIKCPRDNYVPARHRLIYKDFIKNCCFFREDPSSLGVYGFCVSKKMHDVTKRILTSVNDIGIECCEECPYYSAKIKGTLVWVHITNHKKVNDSVYYEGKKYYTKKTKKVKNDMLCIAKNGNKWILTYIYTAKLNNLVFTAYSRNKYTRLIGRKTK